MFNHVRNVVDVVIHTFSYVDADYRPSAWLAYMLTSMPAGNDALVTMLPRLRVDECRSIGCNDFYMFSIDAVESKPLKCYREHHHHYFY